MRIVTCEYLPNKKTNKKIKKKIKKIEKAVTKKLSKFGLRLDRTGYCHDDYRLFDIYIDCKKSKSMAKFIVKLIKEIFKKYNEYSDCIEINSL